MKNDPLFKFVTAIVLAGVLVAFFSPAHPTPIANSSSPEVVQTAAALTE